MTTVVPMSATMRKSPPPSGTEGTASPPRAAPQSTGASSNPARKSTLMAMTSTANTRMSTFRSRSSTMAASPLSPPTSHRSSTDVPSSAVMPDAAPSRLPSSNDAHPIHRPTTTSVVAPIRARLPASSARIASPSPRRARMPVPAVNDWSTNVVIVANTSTHPSA